MKIMIVDDVPRIRKVIIDILKNIEAEFIECANGNEAVKAYDLFHPDFVLMDIEMKGMNGIDATRIIKRKYHDAKICIVTNYSDALLTKAARDAGAVGYVLKENLHELRKFIQG
ncbi:MAG: response regulator transcription factor [Ignavibacteriae bacterium]|nr:response regulator transcription factor [Ignavibacteriota bacterium]